MSAPAQFLPPGFMRRLLAGLVLFCLAIPCMVLFGQLHSLGWERWLFLAAGILATMGGVIFLRRTIAVLNHITQSLAARPSPPPKTPSL